jgi:peptide/nickel transport system ATP-binding protein
LSTSQDDLTAQDVSGRDPDLLLRIDGLRTDIRTRHRGTVHAVDGVDLVVSSGEAVGLVGESGCGKTMTGLSVVQLLPAGGHIVGGRILFNGQDLVAGSPADLRRVRGGEIGMVFQDPMSSLNPTMTIGRQIAEVLHAHRGVSWKEARAQSLEVLGLVGMPRPAERLGDYPHQLSGGLRQRVMIAIALACSPKLLIADEPTTALDVTIQDQILRLLRDLKDRLGMGLLLVTHDLGVIADHADRVVVMYAGKVVESAETGQLFAAMRHPYTEALLESIPTRTTDRNSSLYSIPGLPPDLAAPPPGCRFAPRCRYATPECEVTEPPVTKNENGHSFACFHPLDNVAPRRIPAPGQSRRAKDSVLVEVRDLVKEFPVTSRLVQRKIASVKAVSGVSFDIRLGETLGLVGESGCGKTTLGRMLVMLEKPTSGTISFDGQALDQLRFGQLRTFRRKLQLMFQDPYSSLDPRQRVGSLIMEPLQIQGTGTRQERRQRVTDLLRDVGLPESAATQYPHHFSGGQRQRIGLARALATNPQLLIADEPVSALDVSIQAQILNLMRDLRSRYDLTYVFISHDLSVVRYVADRIAVMYLGLLVEIGPANDIFERPAHPYTRGLLEAIPDPDPRRRRSARPGVVGELPSSINPPSGCRFRTRCPRAQEICASEVPKLRSFGLAHEAACHFPLQQASSDAAGSLTPSPS